MDEYLKTRKHIETSSPNFSSDNSTFCSMTRTDLNNVKHRRFRYGRYSSDADDAPNKRMLRMDIDVINLDNTYTTLKSIIQNNEYSEIKYGKGWKTMNLSRSDNKKGIRFYFSHISNFNCDMDIQDIFIYYEF